MRNKVFILVICACLILQSYINYNLRQTNKANRENIVLIIGLLEENQKLHLKQNQILAILNERTGGTNE